ncbi:MAG TPA: TonB family protein [Candidatus Dormibacteraeota bacterium]|nr:TonB family protein [Candidatus Dormibacteraeota bacterium]
MHTVHVNNPPVNLRTPLALSFLFHACLCVALLVSTIFSNRGDVWGGPGGGEGALKVGLVGSLPGIALPKPEVVTPSAVVDPSKGLAKEEPKPIPREPDSDVKKLPEFEKKPPRVPSHPSKVFEDKTPPASNQIPYGAGGTPAMPYTQFTMSGGVPGGLGIRGETGGGDFGSRYSWYVEAVRNRISSNWLQSTVDATVRSAPRAVVTFQILRDGSVSTIQITQSSGNASVDNSARRAILSSNPLPPLPNGYRGSNVNVEFWFDFQR